MTATDNAAGAERLLRDIAQLAEPEPGCTAFTTVGNGRDGHVRCTRSRHADPHHAGPVNSHPGGRQDIVRAVVCWEDAQ